MKIDIKDNPLWKALIAQGYPPEWFKHGGIQKIVLEAEY